MSRTSVAESGDADEQAIARFVAGDRQAFEELFERYGSYVYNIVRGIVPSEDDAQDVTQDVFLQVYRSLHKFRRGSRFSTWLYRIAVNRAVDAARSHRRRRWLPFGPAMEDKPDPQGDPGSNIDGRSMADVVQRVLAQLDPRHRNVLVLRYLNGMNVEELASVLGCSVGAAKVRLFRARQKFKECYEKVVGNDEHA